MSASVRLSIRRGDQEVASAVATPQPQKIGRSKQCDVILDDPAVSRVHAVLVLEGEQAVLTDQNSQNGLWVQGNRVTRIVLDPSVVVAMGPFRVVCESTTDALDAVDKTILRRPMPRDPAAAAGAGAPVPPAPPSALAATAKVPAAAAPAPPPGVPGTAVPSGPAPMPPVSPTAETFIKPKSPASGKVAAVQPPGSATSEQPVPPRAPTPLGPPPPAPRAAGPLPPPRDASVKPPATPVAAKTERPPTLPPPPPSPRPAAAVPARSGSNQNTALLVVAALVMVIVGGVGAALWLKWRNTPKDEGKNVAQKQVTTSAAPATTTSVVASTSTSSVPASTTTTTTTSAASTTTSEPVSSVPPVKPPPPPNGGAGPPGRGANADLPPGVIGAIRRPRETAAQWRRRSADLTNRLNQAKAAIDKGDYTAAVETLTALQREEPNFGDAAALLARALNGQKTGAQAKAQAAFDEGQQKEKAQDYMGAIQSYQQAERIDPEFAPRVASAINALRARTSALADDLLKRANAEYAFRRPAAIPLYQSALKLLAENDPRRAEAQARLNTLLGIKQ